MPVSAPGWGAVGLYAASCASAGCLHFHFASKRRQQLENGGAAPAPAATHPAPSAVEDTAAGAPVTSLPALRLSMPAKFAALSTLGASSALLAFRQSRNAVETLGWGLASLLFLPLNWTGVEVVPPTVLTLAVPPGLRRLGSFMCACSVSVVGVLAVRRFYSDSASYLAVNAVGAVPLALEVGDWVLRHRQQVQARVNAAVARWTTAEGGVVTFLDEYLNDLVAALLERRSRAGEEEFTAAAVRAVCRAHHAARAAALRATLDADLAAEGLPSQVCAVASHAVERLVGVTVCSSRSVAAAEVGLRDYHSQGRHSEEAEAVRAQLLANVLQGLRQEAASALKFAGFFRSALGLL